DTKDVRECDLHALVAWEVDARDTSHLTLPLLVLRVVADDAHDTLALHHFAAVTNLFYRRANLHDLPSENVTPRAFRKEAATYTSRCEALQAKTFRIQVIDITSL